MIERDTKFLDEYFDDFKKIINFNSDEIKKKFSKIITLTGHLVNNPVKKLGDINLWVNFKAYNYVENIHQFWLLLLVDLVIGKKIICQNNL